MKNKLTLLLLLASTLSFAGTPYLPEIDARFLAVEAGTSLSAGAVGTASLAAGAVTESKLAAANADGLMTKRTARVTFDTANGATAGSTYNLGVALPAKAIITRSYLTINTPFVGASGTVALSCETANNIFSAANITGYTTNDLIEGASTGASTAFKKITSACNLSAVVATTTQSAGKLTAWVEFVISQ